MYSICFCDDKIEEMFGLKEGVLKYFDSNGYSYDIDFWESGSQLFSALKAGKRYDIIFLDIIMPKLDGLDIARQIRALNNRCAIVFVTFSENYAIDGYKVDAFDYLIKPVNQEEINRILEKLTSRLTEKGTITIRLNAKSGFTELNVNKIIYLESSGHYVKFYLKDSDAIRIYGSISDFAPMLTRYAFFIWCHKSYVVNLNFVKSVNSSCFIVKDGINIPISRKNQHNSKKKYADFILNKMI